MRLIFLNLTALLYLLCAGLPAQALSLDELRERGFVTLCVYPNSLPASDQRGNPPGIHLELGTEVAAALGVSLKVYWFIPRSRMKAQQCDLGFDEVEGENAADYGVAASRPYHRTGVVLLLRDSIKAKRLSEIEAAQRIGVPLGSDAETVLRARGLSIRSYALGDEMLAALATGELDAAAFPALRVAYEQHSGKLPPYRVLPIFEEEPKLAWNLVAALRRTDPSVVAAMDGALSQLMQDGRLAAIYARYGIRHVEPK
jgi:ABC-type amino acid transport substrate-binding protein